jgi:hypothetical protein
MRARYPTDAPRELQSPRDLARTDRMRTLLALALVAALAAPALAKDSTWIVCKGVAAHGAKPDVTRTYLVASALEHRAPRGDGRELAVTLIYGDRVSRGTVADSEPGKAGKLETRSVTGKRAVIFTGTAQLDDAMTSLVLAGTLDAMYGDAKPMREPVTATLACETLDDQAIDH